MVLSEEIVPNNISQFIPVVLNVDGNELSVVINNGSGDLFSLSAIDGFIFLPKGDTTYPKQSTFYFLKIT